MNPKKKILILSGCLLTVAAVVGGTFFVQKSSNHVLNKTSIGKFHEAEEHTATGVVVCKTEALQEVFQQKKEEVLLAKQEVPDESEGKNEKTDKKGTQEVTPGKEPTEPASTAGGQTPSAQKNATTSGGQEPVGGIPAAPSDTPSETPAAPSDTPSETPAEETKPANPCPYPLWTVMSFDDGTMGYYWPMDYDIADAVRVDNELYELHYTRLVSTTFVGNYDGAYHVRLSKFSYHIPYADD